MRKLSGSAASRERMISESVELILHYTAYPPWAAREAKARLREQQREAARCKRTADVIGRPATATPPHLKLIVGGKRR